MLQLPVNASGRFTKAQIAELSRSKNVKVRSLSEKPDPIIAMIKRADRAMEKWVKAKNEVYDAKQRLDPDDRGFVNVSPIDEPAIFREFGHGFFFTSEAHVVRLFKRSRRLARYRLAQNRAIIAKSRNPRITSNLELKQRIDAEKRLIAALLKFEPAQRKAVRDETRRLHRVQKAAGLLAARKKQRAALLSLCSLTEKISKSKPISRRGALAVIDYVATRLFPDRADLFMHGGTIDNNFYELLHLAHKVLERDQQTLP